MKRKPPLDGIVILSFEHAIAAPLCTRQLAELGARVIKIERRETGDFARSYDTRTKGQSSHFIWTNRSKERLTLDIKNRQKEMAGSNKQEKRQTKATAIETFPVPFTLEAKKENITSMTSTPTKLSKEEIINQAFKLHSQGNI